MPADSSPKKILIVKLSAIGDVVLSTPVAEALRRDFPDARIDWLVGRAASPLVEHNPYVDRIHAIDEHIFWRKRLVALASLFRMLRRERYDAAYILHWSPWFHLFFWLLGVPFRAGFARDGRSFKLTRARPYVEADAQRHDAAQYLSLVSDGARPERPRLFFSAEESGALDRLLRGRGADDLKRSVAIAPGGGNNPKLFMPQKRWPARYFSELVRRLLVDSYTASIFVVGDADERALLEATIVDARVMIMAGTLSLRQTALLIQRCGLFVGNDSGLTHVAAAVDVPTVAFFGPTSPAGKTPFWSPQSTLYAEEPCSPCYRYGYAPPCPYALRCLETISPDQAMAAIQKLREELAHA